MLPNCSSDSCNSAASRRLPDCPGSRSEKFLLERRSMMNRHKLTVQRCSQQLRKCQMQSVLMAVSFSRTPFIHLPKTSGCRETSSAARAESTRSKDYTPIH